MGCEDDRSRSVEAQMEMLLWMWLYSVQLWHQNVVLVTQPTRNMLPVFRWVARAWLCGIPVGEWQRKSKEGSCDTGAKLHNIWSRIELDC